MSTDQARPKRSWGRMLVLVAALLVVASGCELAATWTPAGTDDSVPERPDRVSLSDVACPDAAACVAIGTQQTVPGSTLQLLVLRQVGSGWQRLDVPAGTSQLLRVGCRAVDDCVISATPADLHVGPGSVTTIPGTSSPDLYGERTIDCVAAGCVEVGADTSRSWDGSAWSADVPLPGDFPPIDRELACTAVDHCVLVATDVGLEVEIDTPARVQTTIWEGTGWSTPTTLDHETRTHGLDCATATTCFAGVGNRWAPFSPNGAPAELLAGDGTSWSPVPLTFPSGQPTEAPSVSCASATSCSALWAGGVGPEPGPSYVGLWDGSTWTVTPTSVAPAVSKLDCSAQATCVAVGGGASQQLAGAAVTDLPLPTGTSPALDLNRLDCATPDVCVGTGYVVLPGAEGFDEYTAALLRWDGTALRREPAIDSFSPEAACGGPDSCIVAGDRGGDQLLSKHWDGEQWVDLPATNGFTSRVGAISCPTATWCLATVEVFSFPSSAPIAWEWSGGTTWSPLPRPSSLSGGGVMAGSCNARRSCVVATPDVGRVLRLDGTTWSEVDVGDLDLGAGPYLSDLSCPTKTFCALSGIRNRTTGTPNAFLAVLRDGTWERTDLPTGQVGAVDCWAASRCVATARQDSNLTWRLLAIGRNGWRDVERPPGAMEPSDVSCPVARECVVSGAFVDGDQRRVLARVHIDG